MSTKKRAANPKKEIVLSKAAISSPISTAYARQLVKNYKERGLGVGDTQGVWFDSNAILKNLGYTDEQIKHLPAPETSVTGIRFYLGKYGLDIEYQEPNGHYNKTTLVMVPTSGIAIGNDGKNNNVYQDILTSPNDPAGYPINKVAQEINDGQICPPPPFSATSTNNDLLYGI